MKILILSSYTTRQKHQPANLLQREDCNSDERLQWRLKELSGYNTEGWYHEDRDYSAPAGEMFTGPLHTQLREGLKQIREHDQYGETVLNLYFPWHAYRVDREKSPVSENDIIVPFDIEPPGDVEGKSSIPEGIVALIESYNLVFLILRPDDIRLLQRVFEVERAVPLIFLIARTNARCVPDDVPNVHAVYTADLVEQIDGVSNYNHQGAVFRKLCETAWREGFHVFEQIKQDPQRLLEIVQS